MADVRRRAEERRRSGEYPPDLEERLDEQFRAIVEHERGDRERDLAASIDRLKQAAHFAAERIETHSRVPGGAAIHRFVAKLVRRQVEGTLIQFGQFADAVIDHAEAEQAALAQARSHLDAAARRLVERDQTIRALEREVAALRDDRTSRDSTA